MLDRRLAALAAARDEARHRSRGIVAEAADRIARLNLALADPDRQRAEVAAALAQVVRAPVA